MGEQGDFGAIAHRKVCVPRQTGDYLSRPRLHNIVDEALGYRLTLVVAPAGYGKTSLLTAWAHRTSVPVA
jgi:LuxR family maltose regulon positive regulatory protein